MFLWSMGLEDIIPDGKSSGSSGSSGRRRKKKKEKVIEIGNPPYDKKFKEKKWEGVKKVIRNEFDYKSVGEVKSLPAEERYDVLHEAALIHEGEKRADESQHRAKERCLRCGAASGDMMVEIEDEMFCISHPAIQVRKALDGEG